jgi:hypothetical protein
MQTGCLAKTPFRLSGADPDHKDWTLLSASHLRETPSNAGLADGLAAEVQGVRREGARIATVPVAVKGPDGGLLDTAIPKVGAPATGKARPMAVAFPNGASRKCDGVGPLANDYSAAAGFLTVAVDGWGIGFRRWPRHHRLGFASSLR